MMADLLGAAGGANPVHDDLSASDQHMEETAPPLDADSHSVKCPECGFSFTPPVDQVGEEVHPEQVRLQVDVDPEILKKLRDVMSTLNKCTLDDDVLKKCLMKRPIDQKELLQLFTDVAAGHKNINRWNNSGWSLSKVRSSTPSPPSRIPHVYTVKVCSVTTGQTCGADDQILKEVQNIKWHTKVEITTDCQKCDIIIVFCPITSRVGSDVEAAMRKIPGDKRVILVLMHHTRDDEFSTNVKKWSETYQNVVLEVHVLFHETLRGLLKSPRNDEAVQQIQSVLKALSKNSWFG